VEVTEDGVGEGYGLALDSVGLDVTAEIDLHDYSFAYPPGGG
jgi:hypothetical protein